MKRSLFTLVLALPLLTALGCEAQDSDLAAPVPTASVAQKLTRFTFDTSGLAVTPPSTLPSGLLSLSAFSDAVIARSLVQTTEPFTTGMRLGALTEMVSANYKFERDATQGAILVLKTAPSGPPRTVDEVVLQRSAESRLGMFGITGNEIGRTLQRQALTQDQDDAGTSTPTVHRYKTFVYRAINRIPVEGHRAVVSHATDGSFVRAFLQWPAIATSGHALRTRLGTSEIVARATTALQAEGEDAGTVRLGYKYVPTALTSGEVVLTLKASARLLPSAKGQETREIDVELDSF